MPTGVYDRSKSKPRGTYKRKGWAKAPLSANSQAILDRMKQLEERLEVMLEKDKSRAQLRQYIENRGLTRGDLMTVYTSMPPVRAQRGKAIDKRGKQK